jgi:hypothetical protein
MDDFSDPSWKIAVLLGLSHGALVALSGDLAADWGASLQRHGYRTFAIKGQADLALAAGTCDAVLHFPARGAVYRSSLGALLGLLNERGQVLGLFRQRVSLFRGVRAAWKNLLAADSVLPMTCRRDLRRARVGASSFWIPLPNLDGMEELSCAEDPHEIAASLGAGEARGALFRFFCDGLGIYASRSRGGLDALLETLGARLMEQGIAAGELRIARFDLRARGALVLILTASALEYGLVCRFGYGQATKGQLQRHWDMQSAVRADLLRQSEVPGQIPRAIAQFDIGEYRCWIEERVVGTVSWRLPARARAHVEAQLIGFLAGMARAAGEERLATADEINAQMTIWSAQSSLESAELAEALEASRMYLSDVLRTQPFRYGWVHGDFGYGNAIVSTPEADLCAIIDWETASRSAPVGIDLFNFLIQRRLAENGSDLAEAIVYMIGLVRSGGLGTQNAGIQSYLAQYLPAGRQQFVCLGLALYRWVRRERRYRVASGWSPEQLDMTLRKFLAAAADMPQR